MWAPIKKVNKDEHGEVRGNGGGGLFKIIGIVVVLCFLLPALMMLIMTNSASYAKTRLEDHGYVVLNASEYTTLLSLLNNTHDDAAAAVLAAEAAALRSESADNTASIILNKLQAFNENEMFLFPDSTNKNITLTAGVAHTFSAWAEVADNTSTTLTSKFAATAGYIREVTLYAYSTPDKLCILELGYGQNIGAVTTIGRCIVRSDFTWVLEFFSEQIPAGEKVYYRFMSEQGGETFKANFKYCYVV